MIGRTQTTSAMHVVNKPNPWYLRNPVRQNPSNNIRKMWQDYDFPFKSDNAIFINFLSQLYTMFSLVFYKVSGFTVSHTTIRRNIRPYGVKDGPENRIAMHTHMFPYFPHMFPYFLQETIGNPSCGVFPSSNPARIEISHILPYGGTPIAGWFNL